jgi:CRISPR-associated protein Csd2
MSTVAIDAPYLDPGRRHDFVMLFEAADSNPNGDPDAGNLPRIDPETNQGLVTDTCLKRKIRNYVALYEQTLADDDPARERLKIYVEEGAALNERHRRAYTALGKKGSSKSAPADMDARAWMCDNFFDVRMFGAVMSTGDFNCGQVRGPVQMAIARSVDPIFQQELAITRVAVTQEDELKKLAAGEGGKNREMGRKAIVPYALFITEGTYSPMLGTRTGRRSEGTGVDSADLELLWQAFNRMWDQDRSAARGRMTCRGVHVFTHSHPLGDAPRHRLVERITVHSQKDTPRLFTDYVVDVRTEDLPPGVGYHGLTE